ncbi:putative lipoprotein [Burkholderia multivorans ATCC BAA-247]|uniref:Putative lipoprotein n=1 Tax=Burkholderia multivorans CGD2 TaxID=513052 RepID=B9BZD7_9BURK|nr:putative lipoprotein [Burkholderia multivorans CGD2]EEE10417.1 putative lipoprotein [Burkholderia multivorans CGD2M]EJO58681.1 putative lipoprotein [Burkholderia multivorans ATCC BAA-247]
MIGCHRALAAMLDCHAMRRPCGNGVVLSACLNRQPIVLERTSCDSF